MIGITPLITNSTAYQPTNVKIAQAFRNPVTWVRIGQQIERLTASGRLQQQQVQINEKNRAKLEPALKQAEQMLRDQPDSGVQISVRRKPNGEITEVFVSSTLLRGPDAVNGALDASRGLRFERDDRDGAQSKTIVIYNRTARVNIGRSLENDRSIFFIN